MKARTKAELRERLAQAEALIAMLHDRVRSIWTEGKSYADTELYDLTRRFLADETRPEKTPEAPPADLEDPRGGGGSRRRSTRRVS